MPVLNLLHARTVSLSGLCPARAMFSLSGLTSVRKFALLGLVGVASSSDCSSCSAKIRRARPTKLKKGCTIIYFFIICVASDFAFLTASIADANIVAKPPIKLPTAIALDFLL